MTVTAPQSSWCPGFSENVGLLVLSVLDDELGDDDDVDSLYKHPVDIIILELFSVSFISICPFLESSGVEILSVSEN